MSRDKYFARNKINPIKDFLYQYSSIINKGRKFLVVESRRGREISNEEKILNSFYPGIKDKFDFCCAGGRDNVLKIMESIKSTIPRFFENGVGLIDKDHSLDSEILPENVVKLHCYEIENLLFSKRAVFELMLKAYREEFHSKYQIIKFKRKLLRYYIFFCSDRYLFQKNLARSLTKQADGDLRPISKLEEDIVELNFGDPSILYDSFSSGREDYTNFIKKYVEPFSDKISDGDETTVNILVKGKYLLLLLANLFVENKSLLKENVENLANLYKEKDALNSILIKNFIFPILLDINKENPNSCHKKKLDSAFGDIYLN